MPPLKKKARTKITAQEKKFCNLYLKLGNYGKAYTAAGYRSSSKNASRNGLRLFNTARVQEYWQEILEQADEELLVSRKDIILALRDIAFSDMNDFLRWKGRVVEKEGASGDIYLQGPEIDLFNSTDLNGKVVQSVTFSPKDGFDFKLEPRLPALKLLAQIKKMLINEVKHSGEVTEKVIFKDDLDE
ncbi:MAG TPA: terminase small subunit [Ignavibacteriales bacterium]|nr:terminase small subunit [Ignavibacteriales bacterium]